MEYLKVAVIMVLYTKCLKREYQIFVNFLFQYLNIEERGIFVIFKNGKMSNTIYFRA